MGTALKILFSGDGMGPSSTVNAGSKRKFQLRRTEIVSLINAFARFVSYEPHHEPTFFFAYAKTKVQISCTVTAQLISTFVLLHR